MSGLRFCNIYGHRITGIPEGSTTDLNLAGDPNSNTMPRSIAMVIKPFKDIDNVITGESGGGFYWIQASDLKISGMTGWSSGNWIDYGTNNDGSWDYTASPNSGCPLNNTEFAPLSQAVTYPGGTTETGNATPDPGIGHNFWRNNLGDVGNWELGVNQVEGEAFDTTLSTGYEPSTTTDNSNNNYRQWNKTIVDVYCLNEEANIATGSIGENLCDRWPDHVQNVVAINTRSLNPNAIDDTHRDNAVFIVITFVPDFDWDEAATIGDSGPAAELYASYNDLNTLMFSIDIEGEATWRPGT